MSVRALRRGTMAGRGAAAGVPTTYTLFAAADGMVQSSHATYATARTGANLTAFPTPANMTAGQLGGGTIFLFESFISFDTSAVAGTIQTVTLSLSLQSDQSAVDFTLEARLRDWGATLEAGDWVPGADLGALPLLASRSTVGLAAGYNEFTSEAAFSANINQSGFTRILLASSRFVAGTAPGGSSEYVNFHTIEDTAGTTRDPKLVIESLV